MTPDDYTNSEFFLDVGDGHQLKVYDWGKHDANVVFIYLHGGPGSSARDSAKQVFNPAEQRVIFFDQRGSGESLPTGSLDHNTTDDLIEDIEKIADHLDLNKFILTGGSWGSCLALAYTLKHPERVSRLVLRGLFTGSQNEIDWVDKGGFASFYPDIWQKYVSSAPAEYHADPSKYHLEQAFGSDPEKAKLSAYAYSNLEGSVLSLDDRYIPQNYQEYDPAGTFIELHYLKNRCFLPDRYILENAHTITAPVTLIQGRYDMVCTPRVAYELSQKLPNATLLWTMAGHVGDRSNFDVSRSVLSVIKEL